MKKHSRRRKSIDMREMTDRFFIGVCVAFLFLLTHVAAVELVPKFLEVYF